MSRPIRARIDLAALRHNHGVARHRAGGARVWSVVKANAYGHGLLRVAGALTDTTDGFALIELDGAIALRESGIRQPILMLEGFYDAEELPAFAEYGLTTVIHSRLQLDAFCAAPLPVRLPVYLKVNTGMNRLGIEPGEVSAALDQIKRSRMAASVTLMTHFADADGERGVSQQMSVFSEMALPGKVPASLANSAGLLRHEGTRADWVRPGIMLYGSSPFPEKSAAELDLKPVMTLESQLIAVRDLKPGDRVGYGGAFTAEQPMRIGVVACGYADGYPRHAPNGTPVLVDGSRTQIIGRVSMDKLCVDLSGLPEKVGAGAIVTLWGEGLPVDEVATAAGTISYQLFCNISARVPVETQE
jgi:alanine racemase